MANCFFSSAKVKMETLIKSANKRGRVKLYINCGGSE